MTEKPAKSESRTIDTTLDIKAPPEAVWKALTDPRELERWFPLLSRVKPGVGGSIFISWGAPWEGEGQIEIWEPGKHLRTTWPFHAPEKGASPLATDYFIEGKGGVTRLRLVHSGFGSGAGWDGEYDGTRRGWQFELRSLRHYLEKHRGEDRAVALAAHQIPMAPADAWPRLVSREGLVAEGSIAGLGEGDRYAVRTAAGDDLRGIVCVSNPPTDFSGTVENVGDSLWRVAIEKYPSGNEIWLWLSAYGEAREQLPAIRERWSALLARLFPDGKPVHRGLPG
ncbi:MAG: SRPBCC domain-containing protein [Planctomycetes bacterium]|nr:SRPBCC domain-containing protein [Planctomycetota bacterium]MBI3845133.1 SRPBCC domain-containing protein [Planctomycetota bacterium]